MNSLNINKAANQAMPVGFRIVIYSLIAAMIIIFQTSCQKFVEVDTPPDKVTQENVYSNDLTATTVLTGLYSIMYNIGSNMSKYGGLLADEFVLWSGGNPDHVAYYTNSLISNSTTNTGKEFWNQYYTFIFRCNAAIEGLTASNKLTPRVKMQLLGESHFLRAWFYFYLVNLYGDLPLPMGTDPAVNRLLARSSLQSVYQLIINDLQKAQELLSPEYVNAQLLPYKDLDRQRVRPTKWAATAMLARVFLFKGEYTKAEIEASKTIDQTALYGLVSYGKLFLKNSKEAIWQVQPTDIGWNTSEARIFHLTAAPAGFSLDKPVYLTSFLLNAFEADDLRRIEWVDSLIDMGITYHFPVKYKAGEYSDLLIDPGKLAEYSMMLRLGEQYLIRAEARARLNDLKGAIADLDMIRDRAKIPLIAVTYPGISQNELLSTILHERQVELFSEWGHRWFDLKRSGQVNAVMETVTPVKGGEWENADQLLPIPYNELLYNPSLHQNEGY